MNLIGVYSKDMITLILLTILALLFGYFATQNVQDVSITLANYTLSQVPLWVVIGISLLVGLAVASIDSLLSAISSGLKLMGKDYTIRSGQSTIQELERKNEQLILENNRLKNDYQKKSETLNNQSTFVERVKNTLKGN
jgi:uncharacterized integral membrane protein